MQLVNTVELSYRFLCLLDYYVATNLVPNWLSFDDIPGNIHEKVRNDNDLILF